MASQYSDWITQPTVAAKMARLELHLAEINAQLCNPDVSKDGASIDRTTLQAQFKTLLEYYTQMGGDPSLCNAGGLSLGRLPPAC